MGAIILITFPCTAHGWKICTTTALMVVAAVAVVVVVAAFSVSRMSRCRNRTEMGWHEMENVMAVCKLYVYDCETDAKLSVIIICILD